MSLIALGLKLVAWAVLALAALSAVYARWTERRFPAIGRMVDVGGYRLHVVERGDPSDPEPLVFLHGASGNLRDQLAAHEDALPPGRRALFVDRPGHGHSDRGPVSNATPAGQADALAAVLRAMGIARATVAGHSYGGAVALAFALRHPERTAALLLLSPVSHPWPGGRTTWYYRLTARPVLGRLFVHTLLVPAGLRRTACAVAGVFAPQPVPEGYREAAATALALRPGPFRCNALDLAALYDAISDMASRYRSITAPTIVIAGADDRIVWTDIHAKALAPAIPDARLVVVPDLGHKPDYVAGELVMDAVQALDRGTVARWRPAVPSVPVLAEPPPDDAMEPGLETGPEAAPIAR